MTRYSAKDIAIRAASTALDLETVRALAGRLAHAKGRANADDRARMAGMLARTAFLEPDRSGEVYDALAAGWIGQGPRAAPIRPLGEQAEPVPEGLWDAWWAVAEDAVAGKLDALSITQRSAALGGMMPEAFVARVARMSDRWPGNESLANRPLPDHVSLETLAACPPGSLGRAFHDLIVDNKFDLEVLDREAIGLSALPKPLDYLNTRILQAHDLWHITAGYETTALHEIAISAFQMAQFGHSYSAQFLSVVAAAGALAPGFGYPVLMDTITTAWTHGRETPPLMAIEWEDVWQLSPEDIRTRYGIRPYRRPWRADLFEKRRPVSDLITGLRRAVLRPRLAAA